MGAGADVNAVFGIMTMVIAIPTGVKMFNWLFTMYKGRIRFTSPMLWFMGFMVLFTIGGVAGVVLAEPAADYQLHNSLFLVAHFHTMIVSGVLFGYFAGFTYWFPKMFGFKLSEAIGRSAFWCWLIGFILAFGPLYVLGFMGATRRLDHYSAALGWQPLFIVAGIGAAVIALGFVLQIVQLIVSIKNRRLYDVSTDDPWEGHTLEWSTPLIPPLYNFAVLPVVHSRDAFWRKKEITKEEARRKSVYHTEVVYEDIRVPQNTAAGIIIAGCVFLFGFGIVWHMWWLVIVGFFSAVVTLLLRLFSENAERVISAAEVAKEDKRHRRSDEVLPIQSITV
jgi:cytochrome o ubiquinol oxidase subunit 1